jgi:hypothetical protein
MRWRPIGAGRKNNRQRRQSPDQKENGALFLRRGVHHDRLVSRLWVPQALFNGPHLVVQRLKAASKSGRKSCMPPKGGLSSGTTPGAKPI